MSIRPMDGGITGWEWEEGGDWGAGLVFVLLTPLPGYTGQCYSEAGLLPGDATAVGIPGSIDLTAVPMIVLVSVSVGTVLTHNTHEHQLTHSGVFSGKSGGLQSFSGKSGGLNVYKSLISTGGNPNLCF